MIRVILICALLSIFDAPLDSPYAESVEGSLDDYLQEPAPPVIDMEQFREYMSAIYSDSVSANDAADEQLQDALAAISEQLDSQADYSAQLNNQYVSAEHRNIFMAILQEAPLRTKYIAFRGTDDSSESYLVYSNDLHLSGSAFVGTDVTICRLYRYRVNSSSSYDYRYSIGHQANYSLPFSSTVLLYTNILSGYPTLRDFQGEIRNICFALIAVFLLFFALIRRKHHD